MKAQEEIQLKRNYSTETISNTLLLSFGDKDDKQEMKW